MSAKLPSLVAFFHNLHGKRILFLVLVFQYLKSVLLESIVVMVSVLSRNSEAMSRSDRKLKLFVK